MDREEWKRPDTGRQPDDREERAEQENNVPEGGNNGFATAGSASESEMSADSLSPSDSYYTVYSSPADSAGAGRRMNETAGQEAAVDYSSAAGTKENVRGSYAWNSGSEGGGTGGESGSASYGQNGSFSGDVFSGSSYGSYEAAGNGGGTVPPDPAGFGASLAKKPKKPLSSGAKKTIAVVLVVVIAFAAGLGGGVAASALRGGGNQMTTSNISIDSSESGLDAASVIAEKAMPSVVGISTVSQTYYQSIFGVQQGTTQGSGTGFIVDANGYILTNSHVVGDGENSEITVDLYDGSEYTGTVLWNDSSLDLAIVKIDATGLQAVDLGDSDDVKIGDYAIAIGNPLGRNFERSVTQGIISGLDRSITTTDEQNNTNNMQGLLQTDASINSGNSGGPLINSSGQVIGITTAKASSAEGLGFAIPINTAIPIIEQIKENGTYVQPAIGVSGMDLEEALARYNLDCNATEGVCVTQIYTNSPASEAGITEGDIITAIDGEAVEDMNALKQILISHQPGDQVTLTIERNKSEMQVQVTLQAQSSISTMNYSDSSSGSDSGSGGYSYDGSQSYGNYGSIFGN